MVVVITKCIILFCFCVSTVMLDRQIVVNGCSGHKVYNSRFFFFSTVMLDRQIVDNGCSDHKVYNSLLFLCFNSHVRSTDSGQWL